MFEDTKEDQAPGGPFTKTDEISIELGDSETMRFNGDNLVCTNREK